MAHTEPVPYRVRPLRSIHYALWLTLSAWAPAGAGAELYYSIAGEGTYDTNVPQNATEYAGWYLAPSLYLKLGSTNERNPLSVWAGVNYENHVQERSAVLNPPSARAGVSLDFDRPAFEIGFDLSYASYHYATWEIARNRYRLDIDLDKALGRNTLFLHAENMVNDYGDNDDDGVRLEGTLGWRYDPRVLKSQRLALRHIGISAQVEHNNAGSDTSSYLYGKAAVDGEIKLGMFALELAGGVAYRKYQGIRRHPHTRALLYPENKYVIANAEFEVPLPLNFELALRGKLRFKTSTYPSYEYDRHTVGARLTWRDRVRPG